MPLVNGKKFPYTPDGKKSAKKALLKKAVKGAAVKANGKGGLIMSPGNVKGAMNKKDAPKGSFMDKYKNLKK